MNGTTLILPGFHGSGPDHWQTWLESRIPGARRVTHIDWDMPRLTVWAEAARAAVRQSPEPVWLVAHSFGCLVAIAAATGPGADLAPRIAGALLVAPADPDRFTPLGPREGGTHAPRSLAHDLPRQPPPFPTLIVASRDDPWMPVATLKRWAFRWESAVVEIGEAGHINTESGFGPWPDGLALLRAFQRDPARLDGLADHGFAALDCGFSSFAPATTGSTVTETWPSRPVAPGGAPFNLAHPA